MHQIQPSLESFVARLPKVELHLHLEGSVRPATLRELAETHARAKAEIEEWVSERERNKFCYSSFEDFLAAFKAISLLLESPSDYALATTRLCEELAAENVRYAELTLSVGVLLWKKQSVEAVFGAVAAAAEEAERRSGLQVRWIFDAVRQFGAEQAQKVLRAAARFRSQGVVAFGIGGDEARGPAELFCDLYREARDLGLHTTAHAGEAAGPESVRKAVELLGAERIGHGLAAARDSELLKQLREQAVPLEICLTSNVATGLVTRLDDHPFPKFLQCGLAVTLNSDDPGMFGTSLEREFQLAASHFSLTRDQLIHLNENAIRAAFLPEVKKEQLLKELRAAGVTSAQD